MKHPNIKQMKDEGLNTLPSAERRRFLRYGFQVTGVFLGGSLLSLVPGQCCGNFSVPTALCNDSVSKEMH
jgi:hypothetical protein